MGSAGIVGNAGSLPNNADAPPEIKLAVLPVRAPTALAAPPVMEPTTLAAPPVREVKAPDTDELASAPTLIAIDPTPPVTNAVAPPA